MEKPELKFYSEEEIESILKSDTPLYYADDGIDEVVIKEEDIPDFIMIVNQIEGYSADLKFYKVNSFSMQPVLTTMGPFLDRAEPELRDKIIGRLQDLQTGDKEPKEIKCIIEDLLERVTEKIDEEKAGQECDFSISKEDSNEIVGTLYFHLTSNYTEEVEYHNEEKMLKDYKEHLYVAGPQGVDYKVETSDDKKRDGLSYELRKAILNEYGEEYTKRDYIDNKQEKISIRNKEAR